MASKRQSNEQEGDDRGVQIAAQHSKRRRGDSQQEETRISLGNSCYPLHITDIAQCISDLVQRLVRDELERRLRQPANQTGTSGTRSLQLDFKNELPDIIFTDSKIKSTDDTPVKIVLYDTRSQSIVTDGPLSSIKIEIYVLNGEFGSDGSEDWTADEFKAKILRQRENKGNLLKGDKVITLKNGVGYITNIRFTDNSSWMRTRQFRLGAKMVQSSSNEANIREGKSGPFVVKDSRGQLNQKHKTPSPNDEIWHLPKISKKGKIRERLGSHEINTVKDLWQLHETNPSSLREIFGKISTKQQKAIIEHAKICVAKKTFDEQSYPSLNTLHSDEKYTCRNVKDFIPVDETSVHSMPSPLANLPSAGQFGAPDLQVLDLPTSQQGKIQDFCQPSSSCIGEAAYNINNQVGFSELLPSMSMEGNALFHVGAQVPPVVPGVNSSENDYSDIQFSNDFAFPPWGWEQGFNACSGAAEFNIHASFPNGAVETSSINGKPKPKAVWCKIRALSCIIRALWCQKEGKFHKNGKTN